MGETAKRRTHSVEDTILPVQLRLTGHLIAFDIYGQAEDTGFPG